MERFWETATDTEQCSLIERIDVDTSPNRYVKSAKITFWEWVKEYNPAVLPFPKVKGGPDNLIRPHELKALREARQTALQKDQENP
jgi:hypothetical protein